MFKKVLVANRGEIAVRIIRACRDLGIKTVAVYSEADRQSLHPDLADERVCLPGFKPADTYLNMEKILQAAGETGAGAVHPGYGYLAENERFAVRCGEAGLVFIGPRPENIHLAGNKLAAKEMARAAGVPVIPGSGRGVASLEEAQAAADETGYPVIIKASAGGGGRGMRICIDQWQLKEEFSIARAEARASFGDDTLYIDKYLYDVEITKPKVLVVNSQFLETGKILKEKGNIPHLAVVDVPGEEYPDLKKMAGEMPDRIRMAPQQSGPGHHQLHLGHFGTGQGRYADPRHLWRIGSVFHLLVRAEKPGDPSDCAAPVSYGGAEQHHGRSHGQGFHDLSGRLGRRKSHILFGQVQARLALPLRAHHGAGHGAERGL